MNLSREEMVELILEKSINIVETLMLLAKSEDVVIETIYYRLYNIE